jgi:hypothetical protein
MSPRLYSARRQAFDERRGVADLFGRKCRPVDYALCQSRRRLPLALSRSHRQGRLRTRSRTRCGVRSTRGRGCAGRLSCSSPFLNRRASGFVVEAHASFELRLAKVAPPCAGRRLARATKALHRRTVKNSISHRASYTPSKIIAPSRRTHRPVR